ncbi:sodium/pantothenate symporter [Hominifimenecus sp. rT4P-3]|uniref:sodium/pantothenate symporter n=1 Tax=Hominifimenecus sp. rT4P-3 TaxID=3242979 RepID=UPI003DA656BD
MSTNQIIILLILLIYMAANVILGLVMSRRSAKENASRGFIQNYFAGGRSMGGLVLAMTLVATYTSASSFLGGPGLAASWGLSQSWVAAIQIGTAFLTLGVIGKRFAIISRKIHAVTVTDYFRARYRSSAVVILCGLCLVIFFITQMVAQFIGGATLVQSVTGLPYWAGLALFGAIVILYTSIGGFKAVVITDTLQGIIMTFGTFLLLFFVIRAGGGIEQIATQLDGMNPGWNLLGKGAYGADTVSLSPGYMISFWVLVGVGVLGLPQTAVRGMGFKDTHSMHRAMIYGTIVVGILMIGMHFAGALTLPLLPEGGIASTDQVIPYVVLNYMPAWAAGLFLAAPLAAVMSTVSSLLILASATILKDLYLNYVIGKVPERRQKAEKKLPRYSFLLTAVLGLIVFLLSLNPPDIIVWINLFAMGGLETTFFWPLIGGLYWKKGNSTCCIVSIVVGLATFIFFNQVKIAPFHIHEIVFGLAAGGIAYFVTGLLSKKKLEEDVVKNCF